MPELDYIAPANPWQVGELEELQRRSSLHWPAYREQLAAHADAIAVDPAAIAAGQVRVAYDHNADTIGFSCTLPAGNGVFELDGLFVDPLELGLGVGRGLVEDVFAWVRRQGGTAVTVVCGPETIAFYERLGFVRTGAAQTRFGPAHAMVAEL
ncbi:MAG: GNAT family N-acetyltransferase [Solirubrobacteraceae bacterium]